MSSWQQAQSVDARAWRGERSAMVCDVYNGRLAGQREVNIVNLDPHLTRRKQQIASGSARRELGCRSVVPCPAPIHVVYHDGLWPRAIDLQPACCTAAPQSIQLSSRKESLGQTQRG